VRYARTYRDYDRPYFRPSYRSSYYDRPYYRPYYRSAYYDRPSYYDSGWRYGRPYYERPYVSSYYTTSYDPLPALPLVLSRLQVLFLAELLRRLQSAALLQCRLVELLVELGSAALVLSGGLPPIQGL
jgi:hypothetical protein